MSAPEVSVRAGRPGGDQPLGPQEASGAAQKSVIQAPHQNPAPTSVLGYSTTGPAKAAQMQLPSLQG